MKILEFTDDIWPPPAQAVIPPEIITQLETACSDIIAFYREYRAFMYRGLKFDKPDIVNIAPHTTRNPKNSAVWLHDRANNNMLETGFKAIRSNSFFCTGDPRQATQYGSLYIVFPYNGFNYSWSPIISDLLSVWDKIIVRNFSGYQYSGPPSEKRSALESLSPENFITTYQYKRGTIDDPRGLHEAVNSGNEIMVDSQCIFIKESAYKKQIYKLLGIQ